MSTSSEGELPEYISTDEAYALIKSELGITTWQSFKQWRILHKVRTVNCLPREAFMEALANSETRGAWRRPGRKQGEQRT